MGSIDYMILMCVPLMLIMSLLLVVMKAIRLNKIRKLMLMLVKLFTKANVTQLKFDKYRSSYFDFFSLIEEGDIIHRLYMKMLYSSKPVIYESFFNMEVINKAKKVCLCETLEDLEKLELKSLCEVEGIL